MVNEAYGDWQEMNAGPKKLDAVTAADVQRVAQTYLVKENQATALVSRKAGSAPSAEDAALADVPEQIRPMIKQSLQRLAAETDAAKLKGEHREDGGPVGPGAARDEEGLRPPRGEGEGAPRRARDGREEVRSGR